MGTRRDESRFTQRTIRVLALLAATLGLLVGPMSSMAGAHTAPATPQAEVDAPTGPTTADLLDMVNGDPTRAVPQVAEGFYLQPLAATGLPTTLAFGPGDDGPDLYVASIPSEKTGQGSGLQGHVLRVHLDWTQAGPVTENVDVAATGFQRPNGLTFDDAGNMYVSDRHANPTTGRADGRITKLSPTDDTRTQGETIVDGLPNGRHSTNHIRFASDGQTLLIPNGNPNDSGCNRADDGSLDCRGGAADVFPISGAVLTVDVGEVSSDPAVFEWTDANGDEVDPYELWEHSVNDDFRAKVDVLASGFRNIYDVSQAPASLPFGGSVYTAMNGADEPSSQDALYKLPAPGSQDAGLNYTYPYCYPAGSAGGVGDDAGVRVNPAFEGHPAADCGQAPQPEAMLGWHTCTTGLDFPTQAEATGDVPDASFPSDVRSSVFVGECTHVFAPDWLRQSSQDPANATHSSSHKVARVLLDDSGEATRVQDFVTGLAAPTDVQFGPDGAMYIADATGIHRVAPATGEGEATVDVRTVPFQFVPQVVVVPQETTVRWQGGFFGHSVTTGPGPCVNELVTPTGCSFGGSGPDTFDKTLTPGGSVSHTFESIGFHPYFCEPHDTLSMTGAVLVTPGVS